jgi:biotin carboxylase
MSRDVLLVGVGRMGRPYISAARRLGVGVRAVEVGARAEAIHGLVDDLQVARGGCDELVAEAAQAAAVGSCPDAVVAFSEEHVMGAALVQDALGLPGPSLHAAVLSRNKALQRGRFAACGLRQPDYVVTDDLFAVEQWAAERLPVVVKPLSGGGSAGVELLADLPAYRAAALRRAAEDRLLVETAVSGPEYSWEGLIRDGAVWFGNVTAKETTGPPQFVEVAHTAAARLSPANATAVTALAEEVVAALRVRTGLVHLEFRLAESGPTVMEVAVRTPGDHILDLAGLAYGIDWFELTLRLALGLPLPEPPRAPVRHAASWFLVPEPGRVTAVTGLAEVRAHPSVISADMWVRVGDVLPPVHSSTQRAGSVVVAAPTRAELDDVLRFVRRTLCVDVAAADMAVSEWSRPASTMHADFCG